MPTSIQGRVVCNVSLDTFSDLTEVPLTWPGGVDRDGLLFDGDLADDEIDAIWWRMTSRDADDEAARRAISDASAGDATNLPHILAAYSVGIPLPAPVWPLL